jgi:hypothetical protein
MLMAASNSVVAPYTITDANAQTWVTAVEGASGDNQTLEDAIKQAVDTYVQALKTNSVWSAAAQLLLPCGPRTLAGALVPLKGAVPTNAGGNFTSTHYNRKTGLGKASNANAYLNSGVAVSAVAGTNHALFVYGAIPAADGDIILIGRYDGATAGGLIVLDESSGPVGSRVRDFRSGDFGGSAGTPKSTTALAATAATCMIGSRTAANATALYVDGTTINNSTSNLSVVSSAQSLSIYGLNVNGATTNFSSAILQSTGIFSTGLNATQAAALRTATATYVAAVAAAIP